MTYKITLKLEGFERAKKRLDNIIVGMGLMAKVKDEEMMNAVQVSRDVLVPIRKTPGPAWNSPYPGWLHDHVAVWEVSTWGIVGGVMDVAYCRYVEFGTRFMHARPYWRPPVWEAWFRMRRRLREMIKKVLRDDGS